MFWQQALNGVVIGCVYTLVALGYTMVYGILGIINFAQGEIYMYGAYGAVITLGLTGNLTLSVLVGISLSCVVGVLLERVAFKPLRGLNPLISLISAIGASIFLSSSARFIFGPDERPFPIHFASHMYNFLGVDISDMQLIIIGASLLLITLLYVIVNHTKNGRAMKAVAMDAEAAMLMGIDVDKTYMFTFLIGSALSGVAGILMAIYYNTTYPTMGTLPGLKAFSAAVLGGVGSIPGAVVGGLTLGVAENLGAAYISSGFKDAFAFLALVLVLVIRPSGIMGSKR